ncbi:uncharacterized protein [Procambarus clarkii]|uniref:uncharacterized protein n=1 Tax=Procambarus clarkii TaxID=6728 RepID=UPI0037427F3B
MAAAVVVAMAAASQAAGKDRQKRFMFINPTAPTLMALLLTIPMSILIPTLKPEVGRSFDSLSLNNDEVLPGGLLWEPAYEEPLLRLGLYFDHLELPLMSCRERLLCEMAASPESFVPIGEAFMKELRIGG